MFEHIFKNICVFPHPSGPIKHNWLLLTKGSGKSIVIMKINNNAQEHEIVYISQGC